MHGCNIMTAKHLSEWYFRLKLGIRIKAPAGVLSNHCSSIGIPNQTRRKLDPQDSFSIDARPVVSGSYTFQTLFRKNSNNPN